MATITLTSPGHITSPDPDRTITTAETRPSKMTIADLLIALGQKVIENDEPLAWMSMSRIAALCRRYKLNWSGGSTRAKDLELAARDCFEKHAEILASDVKVEFQTKWSEQKRRHELLLRFRKRYPDGSLA